MAKRTAIPLLALILLATACGDDSSTTSPLDQPGPVESTLTDTAAPDTDAGPVDGCPAQGFVGQISREAGDGHGAASFSGGAADEVWTEGVVAARLADGGHYTLYASDHVYDGDPRNFETVTAAPGGAVATFSFGFQGGYTAGQRVDLNADEGVTMVVIIDSGGGASSTSSGAAGQFTPMAWNDDWICFDIDYRDDLQSANGVISAPIVAGF